MTTSPYALSSTEFPPRPRTLTTASWLVAVVAFGGLMSAVIVGQALHGDLLDRVASLMRELGIL